MKKLCIVIAAVVLSAPWVRADVLIRQQTRTPAIMGQPAQTETTELWLGEGVMATLGGKTGTILDMNAGKMLIINHETKTYVEASLPLDMTKLMPPEAAQMMEQMMKGMTVSVERTGETKKVAGIDTVSYKVTMSMMGMPMASTYWVAESGLPFDWKKYHKLQAQMAQLSMKGSEQMLTEMSKMQGFPLATEMQIMGMTVVSETVEINAEASPPAGTYGVPAGYIRQDTMLTP